MSPPLLSFILATHLREHDAAEAIDSILAQKYPKLEVVVIVSPVGESYEFLSNRYGDHPGVKVRREQERRGPPAARNQAFEMASGEILVSLDDDAIFRDIDAAENIIAAFESNPAAGFLSFRSEDYDSGEVIPHEIPKGSNGREPDTFHETTYFVGVGAAFRAEAVNATTGFAEDFYYQMEELDFAFQMFREGYSGVYTPDIVVRHKHAEPGRPSDTERWSFLLDNRLRIVIRHLPIWYLASSLLVWSSKVLYETKSVCPVVTAWQNVLIDHKALREQRDIINRATRRKIAKLNGRLWY